MFVDRFASGFHCVISLKMDEEREGVEFVDSDDDNGSDDMDNESFEEEELDYDPDFDANPLTWSPHTIGMKQFDFTKTEGLRVTNSWK